MSEQTEFVTKEEALKLVNHFIDRPGCLDVPVLEDLLSWQRKLTRWLEREKAAN